MKRLTEECGARNAVLRQAEFFPEEGLTYEAFLKVLIPPQQAVARQLLREGFLTRNEFGGIVLSPLVRNNCPTSAAWDENMRAFLARLTTSLAEAVCDCWSADRWAKQAISDRERLRMLVFQHSRDASLLPFEQRISEEALLLFRQGQAMQIIPQAKRRFLTEATVEIELRKNKDRLRQAAAIIIPTLENVLNRVGGIPERNLFDAYDWLSDLYLILDEKKAAPYIDKWRLLKAAMRPSFAAVKNAFAVLYNPLSGDQTVGAMLKYWEEHNHED